MSPRALLGKAAIPILGLALAWVVVSQSALAYTCSIKASCCQSSIDCSSGQGCTCTYTCPPGGTASCSCTCTDSGGGGSCDTCKGQICCEGPSVEVAGVPVGTALKDLTQKTGILFRAPLVDSKVQITFRASKAPFGEWVHTIARQMNTVPVYRGAQKAIEFVPVDMLNRERYSEHPLDEPFDAGFSGLDAGSAVRLIAETAKIDIVVPEKLTANLLDGDFPNMEWRASLQAVLKLAGSDGHVVAEPNGLVRIVP